MRLGLLDAEPKETKGSAQLKTLRVSDQLKVSKEAKLAVKVRIQDVTDGFNVEKQSRVERQKTDEFIPSFYARSAHAAPAPDLCRPDDLCTVQVVYLLHYVTIETKLIISYCHDSHHNRFVYARHWRQCRAYNPSSASQPLPSSGV
jgi:hypothetical protein